MIDHINTLFGVFSETKQVNGNTVVAVANDRQADYKNIRESVGIFPLTFTTYYEIDDEEAEEKLDYLLTKSVQYLNYGQSKLCYFLNDAGEVEAFVTLYKKYENFLVEVFNWNTQAVEQIFDSNGIKAKKLDFSCILFEGLEAVSFLTDVMHLDVEHFVYQGHQDMECFEREIMVARTGYTGEFGYKLIGLMDHIKLIWNEILPENKSKVVGYDAYEMCQYEVKQPFWELPYLSISSNVFEVDYHWLVDFKKDIDYVGKDSLYSIKSENVKKRLIGAVGSSECEIGSDVSLEGTVIGKVVESRFSFGLSKYITMVFIEEKYAQTNVPLTAGGQTELITSSAPYVYPKSWSAGR